jgi:Icc-related predicted phosphoesterase
VCGERSLSGVKILAISDIEEKILWDRFDFEKWKGIDLVISCGDLKSQYLQFIVTMLRVPVFYVRGNHDVAYSEDPPGGCDDVDCRVLTYKGVRFMGFEGSMWYNGQPHQYTEFQMRKKLWKLKFALWRSKGVDVVVTHAPPLGIHDASDQCHKGFKTFSDIIGKYKPAYLIHGHTHLGYNNRRERVTAVGNTQVIDAYGHYIFEV